jgi:hypothetical protein
MNAIYFNIVFEWKNRLRIPLGVPLRQLGAALSVMHCETRERQEEAPGMILGGK